MPSFVLLKRNTTFVILYNIGYLLPLPALETPVRVKTVAESDEENFPPGSSK